MIEPAVNLGIIISPYDIRMILEQITCCLAEYTFPSDLYPKDL